MIAHAPDFVLIAFGMNDTLSAADYSAKHEAMVSAIHAALPDAAVLLVSPMMPNPEVAGLDSRWTLFPQYEQALVALVAKFRAAGFARIGCANVNTVYAAVLAKKRFRDMTGNNINHCNDFSARIYRDTILAAMGLPKAPADNWRPRRIGAVRGWFDGGVADGWPHADSMFGGTWRNPQAGAYADGAVSAAEPGASLHFDANTPASTSNANVTVSLEMEFVPLVEPPLAPADAVAAVTAVWEGSDTNYWVLANGGDGRNAWRRLPGSRAKAEMPVLVEIEFASDGAEVRARYKVDEAVSNWLHIVGGESLHGVDAIGTLHALAGRYRKVLGDGCFTIIMH